MRAPVLTFKRARRLRREMTLPEGVLWRALRSGRLRGLHFRRQHPVGPYILDFYCSAAGVAVELDGADHDIAERNAHDERRDTWLTKRGIHVLRFGAGEILKDRSLDEALTTIIAACFAGVARSAAGSSPAKRGRGTAAGGGGGTGLAAIGGRRLDRTGPGHA